jgi:CDP-diacylglycerol---serine O-phosphatidyltransferase
MGWFIASIYLICGALRLARFNCLAAMSGGGGGKEFLGFPIPAAAGLVASLTLFLMWDEDYTDLSTPVALFVAGLCCFSPS